MMYGNWKGYNFHSNAALTLRMKAAFSDTMLEEIKRNNKFECMYEYVKEVFKYIKR